MKIAILIILISLVVLSLAACGNDSSDENNMVINRPGNAFGIPTENNNETQTVSSKRRILIAY